MASGLTLFNQMNVPTLIASAQEEFNAVAYGQPERIVVSTYTLSYQQTRNLAASQAAVKESILIQLIELGASGFGPIGMAYSAASFLARNAQFNSPSATAAANGQRVRIVVTDYKDYHTSYSLQTNYYIVN